MIWLGLKNKLEKNSVFFLFLGIFVYILIFFLLSFKKYNGFDYTFFDLAIFNQVFFNTSQGHLMDMTINMHNYLGDHFNPFIFLLLPFYYLKASPLTLLFMQSLFIALAAWPLYLLTQKITKSKVSSLIIAFLWLANPFVHNANFFEFHLLTILPFFFFWIFYFYQQNNWRLYILFFILALLIREDVALLLVAFSFFSWLDKKNKKWFFFSFLASVSYFLLAISIISVFAEGGDYAYLIYYGWLGGKTLSGVILSWLSQPLTVIAHIFTFKNIFNFSFLFLPLLFLPFIRPKYLLFFTLPFFQFTLSRYGFTFLLYSTHYLIPFICGIFIALIYSWRALLKRERFFLSNYIYNSFNFAKIILLFSVLYFLIFLSPAPKLFLREYSKEKIALKNEFISLIDQENKVATDFSFLSHLSGRQIIYPIYYAYFGVSQFAKSTFILPLVDYILIDSEETLKLLAEKESIVARSAEYNSLFLNWQNVLQAYSLVKAQNNLFLWQAKKQADFSLPLYNFVDSQSDNNSFLQEKNYQAGEINRLELTFYPTEELGDNIILRFYGKDYYFDIPLGYGIWPKSFWPAGQLAVFYYYLSDDIDSFQIFSWQGTNKLGYIQETVLDLRLQEIGEKIYLKADGR